MIQINDKKEEEGGKYQEGGKENESIQIRLQKISL